MDQKRGAPREPLEDSRPLGELKVAPVREGRPWAPARPCPAPRTRLCATHLTVSAPEAAFFKKQKTAK